VRRCVVIQTMVPVCRKIQNCRMISLMRAISTKTREVLEITADNGV
jgi:hypothetical protein